MDSNDTTDSQDPRKKRPIHRVALACLQCRSRKVRCDATLPTCKRCQVDGKQCEYQKSRRGGRPRRPNIEPLQAPAPEVPLSKIPIEWMEARSSSYSSSSTSTGSFTQSPFDIDMWPKPGLTVTGASHLTRIQMEQLLTQYYSHFHTSHPCILPRWSLMARITTERRISEILLPVLLFIGSIFTPSIETVPLADAARRTVQIWKTPIGPKDPYYIQALVLYSIAVYWCNEPERGRTLLDEAIYEAFALEMHKAEFASKYGCGDPVLEESWRRTWWQIYVTDIHIAGSTHAYQGLGARYPITTELPCEENTYESGVSRSLFPLRFYAHEGQNIPTPATLKSYDVREFSDVEFSSFAQFIGFTQGIHRFLAIREVDNIESAKETCALADTVMTAWCSLLPPSKRRLIRDDGSVDELLFKANILMHTQVTRIMVLTITNLPRYVVDLHRRLSSLRYSAIESISKCAPPPPPESNDLIKDDAHIHTAKALLAVEKLNGLLTLPTRFSTHTPFIICMIANMTIAHLSACRYIFQEPKMSLERDKIRLNMGVLKMLGEFWPAGQREYQTMGIIARELLSLKEEEIQVPEPPPILSLDMLDFNLDFDIDWTCGVLARG